MLSLIPIPGLPDVQPGDDLAALIAQAADTHRCIPQPGDVLVLAQKIVSKAENRYVRLADVTPSPRAWELAQLTGKDPRKAELILRESSDILRAVRTPPDGLIVARHRQGWVCANAGIDESNLGIDDAALLLPEDADTSAAILRAELEARFCGPLAVVISDTFGRPWRHGQTNIAIGLAGLSPLNDLAGGLDAYGRPLRVTAPALADEVATAAGLVMGKADRIPVAIVRGLSWQPDPDARATRLIRSPKEDLFQ